jgi:hypothetical protein
MSLGKNIFSKNESSSPEIKIGSQYGGGIVFTLDRTGRHGLIAAKSDMAGCSSGLAPVKGLSEGFFNWDDALVWCKKSEIGGFSDWFLPNKEQLNQLYLHKRAVGGFVHAEVTYWSSSEGSEGSAWAKDFSHFGAQTTQQKDSYNRVRAVRAF